MILINRLTIHQRIHETQGRATGFDYLRLILASLVVCWHSVGISHGLDQASQTLKTPAGALIMSILPTFFALSGFLVAGSLERSKTLLMFMGLRVIRIFPALLVEVLLSALILGPIFSRLNLSQYFHDPVFFKYFLNTVGIIQYTLPGVFENTPMSAVNGQLWTVPWELKCYVSLAILTIIGAVRHRMGLVTIVVLAVLFDMVHKTNTQHETFALANDLVPGLGLIVSFLAGVGIYLYSNRIIWSGRWAVAAAVISYLLLSTRYGTVVGVFPLAYVTVYLGLLCPRKLDVLRGADYSYGIFLYGFVVQQAFASLGGFAQHWWLNTLVCLPVACLISALSWHYIEKPALGLRKQLVKLEDGWVRLNGKYLSWMWRPSWLQSVPQRGLASPDYRI